ncbi:MAG: ABC transporter substrate-binding protein [Actinobacteria bacterium]|nr:ABC transporter substrate-binding protein [Actinomycetota bacterium]
MDFKRHGRARAGHRLRTGLTLAAALGATALTACGGTPPGTSDAGGTAAAGGSSTTADVKPIASVPSGQLISGGRLTICTNAPAPPSEMYTASGKLIGSDIDTGDAIARLLGLQSAYVQTSFDTIIQALNSGKCDLILAGVFITPERQQQIDFVPYYTVRQSLLVAKGNPEQVTDDWRTLCGKSLALQIGTAEKDTAAQYSAKCKAAGKAPIESVTVKDVNSALQSVLSRHAAAFFFDSTLVSYYAHTNASEFDTAGPGVTPVDMGIGVGKQSGALRAAVVKALTQLEQDGTYDELLKKWGLGGVTIPSPSGDSAAAQ